MDYCPAYLKATLYLQDASLNSYTASGTSENGDIGDLLVELSRFTFYMPDDTGEIYSLKYKIRRK